MTKHDRKRFCRMGAASRDKIAALLLPLTLTTLALAACDPLEVETPDIVGPENLDTEVGLTARRNGVYGDFITAFTCNGAGAGCDGHLQITCLLTDECKSSTTQTARTQNDARVVTETNGDIEEYYVNLHRARQAAETAIAEFEAAEVAPEREEALSELNLLAGYSYVLFGEDFCSGVPFSDLVEGDIEFGAPTPTDQIFERAVTFFDAGIAAAGAGGHADLEGANRVGKARALLSLARYQEAAQAVDPVPDDLDYTLKYSTNTTDQENGIFGIINTEERISVTTSEGINGLDYFGAFDAGDPRTPYEKDPRNGVGFDSSVEMFLQLKYGGRDSPISLATGIEARLVKAEAALQAGDVGTFQAIHDALRASIGLDPVDVGAMSAAERTDFHFAERAFWFWLDGHRLGDYRRLVRNYGRDTESVYPTGDYFRPQFTFYGDAAVLLIPQEEDNNPQFGGCLSTDA